MADKKPIRGCVTGVPAIMNAWELMNDGKPFFAIFYGLKSGKYIQWNKDDYEAAKEFLFANLSMLAETGDNSQYYLNIYPDQKNIYTGSGELCCFPFRLNVYEETASGIGGVPANMEPFAKMLQDSNDRHIALIKEIAELKSANQPLDWYDRITGIMETPGAAQMIVPMLQPVIASIMGIVNKISGVPAAATVSQYDAIPRGIAGPGETIDANDLLDVQLDRLEKHGDLLQMLTSLADFAEKEPAQFKMYLQMLTAK